MQYTLTQNFTAYRYMPFIQMIAFKTMCLADYSELKDLMDEDLMFGDIPKQFHQEWILMDELRILIRKF
jgi:hypothetical protein